MFLDGFSFKGFVEECYRENTRRMGISDPALLQPRFMPRLADAALASLRLWNRVRPGVASPVPPRSGTPA